MDICDEIGGEIRRLIKLPRRKSDVLKMLRFVEHVKASSDILEMDVCASKTAWLALRAMPACGTTVCSNSDSSERMP
jgi:hypothetical protein